jgi:hypothetical protein
VTSSVTRMAANQGTPEQNRGNSTSRKRRARLHGVARGIRKVGAKGGTRTHSRPSLSYTVPNAPLQFARDSIKSQVPGKRPAGTFNNPVQTIDQTGAAADPSARFRLTLSALPGGQSPEVPA